MIATNSPLDNDFGPTVNSIEGKDSWFIKFTNSSFDKVEVFFIK
jgi:hypothetical protein